jgi:hypothetical protein
VEFVNNSNDYNMLYDKSVNNNNNNNNNYNNNIVHNYNCNNSNTLSKSIASVSVLSSFILIENLNTKEEGSSPFAGRSQTNLSPKRIKKKKRVKLNMIMSS